jgi:hypothetical protein
MVSMQNFKKAGLLFVVIFACLFIIGRYVYYGSLFRTCIYTQEIIPVPERIKNGYFVTFKDSTLMDRAGLSDYDECLPYFTDTNVDFLISQREASNLEEGRRGKTFPSGQKFKMIDIVSVTKHGISTIDSGSGPTESYIVEDENGARHSLLIPLNDGDSFALFFIGSSTEGLPLIHDNFFDKFQKLLK